MTSSPFQIEQRQTAPSQAELHRDVATATGGDRAALERVVRAVQPLVSRLALRFFGCPAHAADATQEALVQVITKLDRFDGDAAFTTWVYRVATNKFLSMKRSPVERASFTFDAFDRELSEIPNNSGSATHDVDRALLLEEIKVGCTLAMLICLERDARMAYILGAIVELDHDVAAEILGVASATYRKRLQRARDAITDLMRKRCGLFDAGNVCRCDKRISIAIERGRLDPKALLFASSPEQARQFPQVLHRIRRIEEVKRAAALYQSHPDPALPEDFATTFRAMLAAASDDATMDGR